MKIEFLNILTVIFVIAKLFGAIEWSWLLVFAPTIACAVLYAILLVLYVIADVMGK